LPVSFSIPVHLGKCLYTTTMWRWCLERSPSALLIENGSSLSPRGLCCGYVQIFTVQALIPRSHFARVSVKLERGGGVLEYIRVPKGPHVSQEYPWSRSTTGVSALSTHLRKVILAAFLFVLCYIKAKWNRCEQWIWRLYLNLRLQMALSLYSAEYTFSPDEFSGCLLIALGGPSVISKRLLLESWSYF
jgi:hypothetical protein